MQFNNISTQDFLQNYWQKKPILLKNAIKINQQFPSADELAGMALDYENARIVSGNYNDNNWQMQSTPFDDDIFSTLPEKNWTLLVQGVDRILPSVCQEIANFDFLPRWKFDDVMMSYASVGGSVGPHFDYYDVFLLQTSGTRKWQLSTKNCTDDNYNPNFDLKIMQNFECELEFIAEVGDVLYVPPKCAHFGVSLSDDCITTSFGYRSYSADEIAEFCQQSVKKSGFYQDPIWQDVKNPALIPNSALKNAQNLTAINSVDFAKFITKTDLLDVEIWQESFADIFDKNQTYVLNSCLKIAYTENNQVFITGEEFKYDKNLIQNILKFCNTREIFGTDKLAKELFDLNLLQEKNV